MICQAKKIPKLEDLSLFMKHKIYLKKIYLGSKNSANVACIVKGMLENI